MSATVAQQVAQGGVLDDQASGKRTHREMLALAKCGCSGAHQHKIWSDLQKSEPLKENQWPEPLMVPKVPILDRRQHPPKVVYTDWPIFLMQDVLHWTYTCNMQELRHTLELRGSNRWS